MLSAMTIAEGRILIINGSLRFNEPSDKRENIRRGPVIGIGENPRDTFSA
jgi:hypothetical protein